MNISDEERVKRSERMKNLKKGGGLGEVHYLWNNNSRNAGRCNV
jgi:hypothetical protein